VPAAAPDMSDDGHWFPATIERLRQDEYPRPFGVGMVLPGQIQRARLEHHPEMPKQKEILAEFAVGLGEICNHL
jgi:hypothetical protein